MSTADLSGKRVVTTRDQPGELDRLLVEAGVEVVHVPLIAIAGPLDGGAALVSALVDTASVDWVVVTSWHGATRVGRLLGAHPNARLAAVGTRTAHVIADLAGRPIDVVPARQTAADLLEAMPDGDGQRLLLAQGDRADPALAIGLAERGFDVHAIVAYRTELRQPSPDERIAALSTDAVAFASGSAALAWASTIGSITPPVVAAIGPVTADVARANGLVVTHVAVTHDVPGLVAVVAEALAQSRRR
jgi:uroporphyrinogen-III synthase